MSIHDQNALSIPRRLEAWIAEYEAKVAAVPEAIAAFEAAANAINAAACIGGTWGEETIDTGRGIGRRNQTGGPCGEESEIEADEHVAGRGLAGRR